MYFYPYEDAPCILFLNLYDLNIYPNLTLIFITQPESNFKYQRDEDQTKCPHLPKNVTF